MNPCCHQSGEVRHIHQIKSAHPVGNGAHAREIDFARIRAATGNQQIRFHRHCLLLHHIIVDQTRMPVDMVMVSLVNTTGLVDAGAVAEMTAGGKV